MTLPARIMLIIVGGTVHFGLAVLCKRGYITCQNEGGI